ncbi:thioesterase domain-containing protein [Pararhodobacter zhoushanensis]|uniref:Thioesterase domain-containing protein n=1 Tax=Pararhodobacter zhoushanensis TaxID=2479545 RepID=A0ABT3H0M2_9RHOB|nr:thioesterase domain-containing protein [Pararhodobacter zhoushanensis]MCW1933339.1 hypothetical protein [Pararhodobacter zhoushanensis]
MSGTVGQVRRRRVFYVPGYDPFPPRRYRELYRREGPAQAAISGYTLTLQPAPKAEGRYAWQVHTAIDGLETEAQIDVLVWADLVRASMERGIVATYLLLVRTLWTFLRTGAIPAMLRFRPLSMLTAAWPVGMLLGQLLLALFVAGMVWWGLAAFVGGWAAHLMGAVLGVGIVGGFLAAFRRLDAKFYAYYLLYDFAEVAAHNGAYSPELQARLDHFADLVTEALTDGAEEVLIIGHSSGAALAVTLAAAVERRGVPVSGAKLALLTLGQAIPMQAFLPDAQRLRADVQQVAGSSAITWVDVSAKGDGVCFWLTDPAGVCGVANAQTHQPLVFSAAFSEALSAEKWHRIRRKFFQVHFQYLAAFDRPRDYDYFQITAGPVLLADRYRDRAPSPQVERRAFSPHRSVA